MFLLNFLCVLLDSFCVILGGVILLEAILFNLAIWLWITHYRELLPCLKSLYVLWRTYENVNRESTEDYSHV